MNKIGLNVCSLLHDIIPIKESFYPSQGELVPLQLNIIVFIGAKYIIFAALCRMEYNIIY